MAGSLKLNIQNRRLLFFNADGSDFLHFGVQATFTNFSELLDGLKLTEFERKKTFLGIDSALEFEALCEQLQKAWQTKFVPQSDDRYGWFNFERWYKTDVPLYLDDQTLSEYADANGTSTEAMLPWLQSQGPGDARRRLVKSLISPNRHRSGTCLYPDDPDLTAVLEIPSVWFPKARAVEQLAAEISALSGVRNVVRLPF